MEAKELRIGNLVKEIATGPCTANIYVISFIQQANISGHQNDRYTAIPLTSEWLERLGFVREPSFQWWDGSYTVDLYVKGNYAIEFTTEGIAFMELTKAVLVTQKGKSNKGNHWIKLVKHTHDLQNLYFALTGEELTVKDFLHK